MHGETTFDYHNTLLNGKYKVFGEVGKGGFGQILEAFNIQTTETVVIKIVSMARFFMNDLYRITRRKFMRGNTRY